MRSTAAFGRLEQFHLEPELDVGGAVQRPDAARPLFEKRTEPAGATPTEVSFGPFRLLRTQFLLLEGDKPVPLGSRALEILIALLERHGELVSKQDLMARVWPNVFVEPANLTVHMSALRRALRDGQDRNRLHCQHPRTRLLFRRLSRYIGSRELSATGEAPGNSGEALPWSDNSRAAVHRSEHSRQLLSSRSAFGWLRSRAAAPLPASETVTRLF